MTDIVERLRTSASQAGYPKHYIYDEAAAEIERLRADRHMWRERADMWRDESVRKQAACEQMGARIAALEAEARETAARREGIEAAWHVIEARAHECAVEAAAWQRDVPEARSATLLMESRAKTLENAAAAIRALLEDK